MHRRSVLRILTAIPATAIPATLHAQQTIRVQEPPKHPADVTFREGGKTRHYDNITFGTDSGGSFWLYTERPQPPPADNEHESIPVANIKSIETPGGEKKPQPPFPVTVTLKNNDVLKGWADGWSIGLDQNSLPAPMGTVLSKVTKITYDE